MTSEHPPEPQHDHWWECQYGHRDLYHWGGQCIPCRNRGERNVIASRRDRQIATPTPPPEEYSSGQFRQGELLEFRPQSHSWSAQPGARARVDGSAGNRTERENGSYVVVRWDRSDPRVRDQNDGGYFRRDFVSLCPRKDPA